MTILIAILKILGTCLLVLLALAVLIVLMLLFVPVRYKILASYNEEAKADIRISYLLHALTVRFIYEEVFEYKIRIFGIPFKALGKKKSNEDATLSNDKEAKEIEAFDNKTDAQKKKFDKETLVNLYEYIDILNSDEAHGAWECCKKRALKLIRHIMPGKVDISIVYGMENPAYTGFIIGLYNVFLNYLSTSLKLMPVFSGEENFIDGKAMLKGRMRPAPVLLNIIIVILNKDCRAFYMLIKRKTKGNARIKEEEK